MSYHEVGRSFWELPEGTPHWMRPPDWMALGSALGKEYQIRTSVPLIGTFTADIPIEQMTADGMEVIKEEAKQALPYVIGGLVILVGVTVAIVGAFVIGRKTA